MSERVAEEVESLEETDATEGVPTPRNVRREQLLALLRTQEGRRQAWLIADILALPLAMRPRRLVGRRFGRPHG